MARGRPAMGLTRRLARCAARRAHVLLVEAPGFWVVRAQTEHRLRVRGWCVAESPADADVLAICGTPGPELNEAIDRVWDQMPGPRVRVELPDSSAVESALHRAAMQLAEVEVHRRDARERAQSPELNGNDHGEHEHQEHHATNHGEHEHHQHGNHVEHEHTEHNARSRGKPEHTDHSAHQHMHHGGMDMAPAGIALAEGGDDRDGLEMDVLHLRLGPVLRYWPAGLVVRCSLQGDVLTQAETWIADREVGDHFPPPGPRAHLAARYCDHVVDLLALAAWPGAAAIARRARDELLGEADAGHAASRLDTLHSKLRRSPTLRWSLRDVASLTPEDCKTLELPTALAGDCYDRLLAQVDMARHALTTGPSGVAAAATGVFDAVPGLVSGLDVGAARLVIASLGIDTTPHPGGRYG
ncbi:MAG: hypothetical protein CK429_03475 [Mycobacterium sp.]|nr:MAG: hypothetical protein CK429_03475 [Mycobacterium sp.]